MKRHGLVVWRTAFLVSLLPALFQPAPCGGQTPQSLTGIENELREIQRVLDGMELWLRDFCTVYQRLASVGMSWDGQPRDTLWSALAQEKGIRYAAADILTRPHPFESARHLQFDAPLEPVYYRGPSRMVRSVFQLRDLYDQMAGAAPGLLASFRRHEDRRQALEHERAFLLESSRPLTAGPDQGTRGGRRGADADSLVALGMRALEERDFEGARERFDSALQLNPGHARAFFGRGMTSYLEWGDLFGDDHLRTALPDFDRAVNLDPGSADARYMRGKVRVEMGDVLEGIRDYQEACEVGFEEACKAIRTLAMEKDSRGVQLLGSEDYESANRLFSEAIQIDHRYPDAWFDRALTWAKLGSHQQAIEDFDAFILHHENAESYFRARHIPLPDPDPSGIAEAHFRSGFSMMRLERFGDAARRFDQAIEKARLADPSRLPLYLHHAGDAYMRLSLPIEARTRYDEACRLQDREACAKRDRIGG